VRKLRIIRIVLATFFLLAVTACFLDFTGTASRWFGWTVKLQLMPAALALSLVAAAILVVTFLCGRVYCSVVCPLGILQDIAIFLRRVFRLKFKPAARGGVALVRQIVRGLIAAAFFAGGFLGIHFLWLEPYGIYGRMAGSLVAPLVREGNNHLAVWAARHGSYAFHTVEVVAPPLCMVVLSASLLALILVLALWKGRFWCNTVCPVGTVLGCVSRFSLLKPRIDLQKCVKCRLCEKACKAQSIDVASGTIDLTTCVACFDCGAACGKGALKWSR
jgi:polyferredoxin